MEQRSNEWRAARLGKITGTRAAALMGTEAAQMTLLCEMVREYATASSKEIPMNAAMKKGVDDEDLACSAYALETGRTVTHAGLIVSKKNPRLAMSPDGLINTCGGVEIKNLGEENHIRVLLSGKPDPKHVIQCEWGLFVSERQWWDLYYYAKEMPTILVSRLFRITLTAAKREKMVVAAEAFLARLDTTLETLGLVL